MKSEPSGYSWFIDQPENRRARMQSKTKGKKGQAKEREQRRQKKLEKQRRQGKGTAHGPRPTRDQKEVAKRLLAV